MLTGLCDPVAFALSAVLFNRRAYMTASAAVVRVGVGVHAGVAARGLAVVADAGAIGVLAVPGAAIIHAGAIRLDTAHGRRTLNIACPAMVVVEAELRETRIVAGTGVKPRFAHVIADAACTG